jgi:hypothetical protein
MNCFYEAISNDNTYPLPRKYSNTIAVIVFGNLVINRVLREKFQNLKSRSSRREGGILKTQYILRLIAI